jgi:hypothetical protein
MTTFFKYQHKVYVVVRSVPAKLGRVSNKSGWPLYGRSLLGGHFAPRVDSSAATDVGAHGVEQHRGGGETRSFTLVDRQDDSHAPAGQCTQ